MEAQQIESNITYVYPDGTPVILTSAPAHLHHVPTASATQIVTAHVAAGGQTIHELIHVSEEEEHEGQPHQLHHLQHPHAHHHPHHQHHLQLQQPQQLQQVYQLQPVLQQHHQQPLQVQHIIVERHQPLDEQQHDEEDIKDDEDYAQQQQQQDVEDQEQMVEQREAHEQYVVKNDVDEDDDSDTKEDQHGGGGGGGGRRSARESQSATSGGATSTKYRYDRQCPSCGNVLSTLYALKLHIAKKHPEEQKDLIPLIKQTQWRCMQFPCTVDIHCAAVCKGRKELLEHMQNDHGVAVEWIDHSFETRDDFETFRRELRSNGTVFIKATSRYKQAVGWAVYRCNREGNKDERKNRPRTSSSGRSSSIKIGTFCTAYCKVYYEGEGIRAFGSTTHVNHEVNGQWPEHTMRAPEPEERLLEVTRDDGTVTHEIVKVIEEPAVQTGATARSMLRCEDDQVLIATEDSDSGGHMKLDALVMEAVEELRTIFEECQGEAMVIYADRLRKFYRNLGEAVGAIVGDDFKAKRSRMAQGTTSISVSVSSPTKTPKLSNE